MLTAADTQHVTPALITASRIPGQLISSGHRPTRYLVNNPVQLPLWSVALLCTLALLWFVQHFLLPSIRWFVRRRANLVISEVNDRLALKIPSFKLKRREVLIDRISYDAEVLKTVDEISRQQEVTRDDLMKDVNRYAGEIVPAFNALLYFKTAYWFARKLVHSLYRVRLGFADDQALAELSEKTSVVFIMNHRSNMDYIVATYLAAEKTALSYAVGEWARVWPLQQLIRLMGGYFVRRNSSNVLYRKVLQTYVQMAASGGVPQAVFPEGRLSKDGTLGEPKLGLLGYITKGFDPSDERDIVFIPVGINYDRVLEDRSLTLPKSTGRKPGKIISTYKFFRFAAKNVVQAIMGKRYRNGYACVNFGEPVSLKEWLKQHTTDPSAPLTDVSALAEDLLQRIGQIIPILPVALVATVALKNNAAISELELKSAVFSLLHNLEQKGYRAYIPRGDREYAVTVGIRMLTLRRLLHEADGMYSANPDDIHILQYYANSISHLVDDSEV